MIGSVVLPPRYADPERIAVGGMGEVFLSHDRELDRDVAVKVLGEQFAGDAGVRRRFLREALAAARLSGHPNVVTIYDVGESDDRPFIVMEHVAGGTLADRIGAGPVDHDAAVTWLGEAADALDAAHALGIVHRDVKPANLLFDGRGTLRVGDFGIARVADEATAEMTAVGTVVGTAGYLSPEQARGDAVGPASDVYSLAVVAFELLTGSRPFERPSQAAEAAAHVAEPAPPASAVRAGLPPAVDEVLARALDKDPDRRPPSARAFVAELRAAVMATDDVQRATPAPAAIRVHGRRARWPLLAVVAVLLLAAATGLAAVVAGDDDRAAARDRPAAGERRQQTGDGHANQAAAGPSDVERGIRLNSRGAALMQDGRYAEALAPLRRAVRLLRGSGRIEAAAATYNLGTALLRLGRCAEALPYLRFSADRRPARQATRDRIAEAQACLGSAGAATGAETAPPPADEDDAAAPPGQDEKPQKRQKPKKSHAGDEKADTPAAATELEPPPADEGPQEDPEEPPADEEPQDPPVDGDPEDPPPGDDPEDPPPGDAGGVTR